MTIINFGLACPKKEGGTLWPPDYLMMSGRLPSKKIYSREEQIQLVEAGYWTYEWINDL